MFIVLIEQLLIEMVSLSNHPSYANALTKTQLIYLNDKHIKFAITSYSHAFCYCILSPLPFSVFVGVTVSQDRLSEVLQKAAAQRQRCIAENPLYNASHNKGKSYYPFSQHHAFHDGMLIRSSTQKSVFLLEGGKKRPFTGGRAFLNMGFDFDSVQVIADQWDFDRIPLGATLG